MNKNNFRLLLLSVFISIVGLGAALADVTTPYSMYGYGILGDRATSMQRQMGGIGVAMNSGRQINAMNPASYCAIDSLTFLFDMGVDVSMLWSKEKTTPGGKPVRENSVGGGLNYITMQFPIGRYMGGSIGLIPYSSVGYAFGNEIEHGAMTNQGSGGINEAYLGFSGGYAGFSLGFNVAYAFGNIQNDVFSTPDGHGQNLFEHVMQIRDWSINLGAQYTAKVNKTDRMVIGFTFAPKKTLLGKSWVTNQAVSYDSKPDTVGYLNLKNNYYTPNSYAVGVSYSHVGNSRWSAEVDASIQQWSKCKYSAIYDIDNPEIMVFEGMKFNDRLRLAAGGEWVPKVRGNYGQRIAYRLGAYFCRDYLNIKNGNTLNSVREFGVSCGVGLHTPSDKTMINIGLEWKQRAAHPQKLITENYFNVSVGINFNELWFWQRKIR